MLLAEKNLSKGGKKEKTQIFVQNDLFWTHTAKTKHFLAEFVLEICTPQNQKNYEDFVSNFFF